MKNKIRCYIYKNTGTRFVVMTDVENDKYMLFMFSLEDNKLMTTKILKNNYHSSLRTPENLTYNPVFEIIYDSDGNVFSIYDDLR